MQSSSEMMAEYSYPCSGSLTGNNKKNLQRIRYVKDQHLMMTMSHSSRYNLFKNLFSSGIPSGNQPRTKGQAD